MYLRVKYIIAKEKDGQMNKLKSIYLVHNYHFPEIAAVLEKMRGKQDG